MDGDVKKTKLIQIPKFLLPETLTTAEVIPLDLGCRLNVSSISINELGKQLLQASICGNVEEIKLLMSKGAPFTADWLGTSPLHFAAQKNHLEVCEILLRAGISKDARTKVDRTPLHMAVFEGNTEIVKCLLNNKADVNCKDLLNMTPLHWAAQRCHAEIAEILIRYGAQTDVINKFDLTPLEIALQCDRHDIADIINMTVHDPEVAAQNLTTEMSEMDSTSDDAITYDSDPLQVEDNCEAIPLETVLLEGDCENSPERGQIQEISEQAVIHNYTEECADEIQEKPIETENTFSESIKLLQQHGITMLPSEDDSNILSSILETGHSVVLTEVGKEVLNSTKPFTTTTTMNADKRITPKIRTIPIKPKKVITVTPQEFLAMTLNQGGILKQVNGKLVTNKSNTRRIVMQKNKVGPILTNANKFKLQEDQHLSDTELLMRQLIDARKLVEEYKQKFLKKEAEAERYKQQLLLITQSKNDYC